MTRSEGLKLLRSKMREHGLSGWTAKINTNKRRLGVCKLDQRQIELSVYHVTESPEHKVLNTILHEIAHALVGIRYGKRDRRLYHDEVWRQKAIEIGCDGNRCGDAMNVPPSVVATCSTCDYKWYQHRKQVRRKIFHLKCMSRLDPMAGLVTYRRLPKKSK